MSELAPIITGDTDPSVQPSYVEQLTGLIEAYCEQQGNDPLTLWLKEPDEEVLTAVKDRKLLGWKIEEYWFIPKAQFQTGTKQLQPDIQELWRLYFPSDLVRLLAIDPQVATFWGGIVFTELLPASTATSLRTGEASAQCEPSSLFDAIQNPGSDSILTPALRSKFSNSRCFYQDLKRHLPASSEGGEAYETEDEPTIHRPTET